MFLHDTAIATLFVILAFIDIMTIINKIMPWIQCEEATKKGVLTILQSTTELDSLQEDKGVLSMTAQVNLKFVTLF